jgi:hypothetical protein
VTVPEKPRTSPLWLVGATLVAAPVALAFESGLRWLLFPADFEVVRTWLGPALTVVAWALVGLAAAAGIGGAAAQRTLVQRKLARLPSDAPEGSRQAACTQVFLLTASIPQVPVLMSTFTFMFGASIVPTVVGVALCTMSVLVQGRALRTIGWEQE